MAPARMSTSARPAHLRRYPKPVAFRMKRAGGPARNVPKKRKHALEISQPDAAPGRRFDHRPGILKDQPAIIGGDRASAPETKIETLDRFPAENKQSGQKREEHGECDGDSTARPFAENNPHEPGRNAEEKNENAGPGKCDDERGAEHSKSDQPEEPAFVTTTKVVLHAAEDDESGNAKQVARLVAIGERAEAACVVPKGQSRVFEMEINGQHRRAR